MDGHSVVRGFADIVTSQAVGESASHTDADHLHDEGLVVAVASIGGLRVRERPNSPHQITSVP